MLIEVLTPEECLSHCRLCCSKYYIRWTHSNKNTFNFCMSMQANFMYPICVCSLYFTGFLIYLPAVFRDINLDPLRPWPICEKKYLTFMACYFPGLIKHNGYLKKNQCLYCNLSKIKLFFPSFRQFVMDYDLKMHVKEKICLLV